MSGHHAVHEPQLRSLIAAGRRRDLRNLLLSAADAARACRRAAERSAVLRRSPATDIRERLSAFLARAL